MIPIGNDLGVIEVNKRLTTPVLWGLHASYGLIADKYSKNSEYSPKIAGLLITMQLYA